MSDYHQQHAEAALCADVSPTAKRERSNANLEGVLGQRSEQVPTVEYGRNAQTGRYDERYHSGQQLSQSHDLIRFHLRLFQCAKEAHPR